MRTETNIAVIAVHGVGSPPGGQTARAVTGLLEHSSADRVHYSDFVEVPLRIQLHPLRPLPRQFCDLAPGKKEDSSNRIASFVALLHQYGRRISELYNERTRYLHRLSASSKKSAENLPAISQAPDFRFMNSLLESYLGASGNQAYGTIRLEGKRKTENAQANVDVYEVNWGDITHGASSWKTALQVFPLLLSVLNLGRLAIDFAAIAHTDTRRWRFWRNTHAWAIRVLSLTIPALVALWLLLLCAAFPLRLPIRSQAPLGIVILGISVVALTGFCLYQYPRYSTMVVSSSVVLVILVTGLSFSVVTSYGWDHWHAPGPSMVHFYAGRLLVFEWLVVCYVALLTVFRVYDRIRPGALIAFVLLSLLVAVNFVEFFREGARSNRELQNRPEFTSSEWQNPENDAAVIFAISFPNDDVLAALAIAWLLFTAIASASGMLGFLCVLSTKRTGTDRGRAWRTMFTANLSLGASVLLLEFVQSVLLRLKDVPWFTEAFDVPIKAQGMSLGALPYELVTMALPSVLVGIVGLNVGVAMWALLPSVFAERKSFAGSSSEATSSVRMGIWLSHGGQVLRRLGGGAIAIAVPLTMFLSVLFMVSEAYSTYFLFEHFWEVAGTSVAAVALIGFSSKQVSSVLASVVGVAIDIEAYLREQPLDCLPRARIVERYASTLHHVNERKFNDSGAGYDAIVIVSHSQGSVIVADSLRFMNKVKLLSQSLPSIVNSFPTAPVFVVTFGSPLLQLYATMFPNLYGWVEGQPEHWKKFEIAADEPFPCPEGLGVANWTNLYRSGDYIGRQLWRRGDYQDLYSVGASDFSMRRDECIGAGGHTHYWDSPALGKVMDDLFASICDDEGKRAASSQRTSGQRPK